MPMSPASSLERAKRPLSLPSNDFGSVVETLTAPCVVEEEEWRESPALGDEIGLGEEERKHREALFAL